ncbi:MAG: outer membrane protein assembly factor BamD [Phycisphaerae bacterium]
MLTPRYTNVTVCVIGHLLLAAVAPSAWAQEEQYRERQVLDPESDEWLEQPVEEEVAPADTLDGARRRLAEGQYGKAYKLLKEWTKEHPEHERYFEGLYLLGEAEFERRHFYQAYESYEVVAENTAGELFYKALRREMDVARAFLSGEKRIAWKILRLPAYDDGIEILDRIWERVPGTRLGEAALKLKADYFFDVGDMDLAEDEYVNLTREYPNGRYVQLAMLRGAEAAEAAFPGIRFDDRALLDAQVRYRQVHSTFPGYAEREQVATRLEGIRQQRAEKDLDIARWYERTKQTGAAEFYYRLILKDWPDTLAAAEAQSRLRALGAELPEEEAQP